MFPIRELLHNTLSVQSKSGDVRRMNKYITRFAHKHGISWYEDKGNLYLTKGNAELYPCIVAHTDTVHAIIPDFVVNFTNGEYTGRNRTTNAPHGVGGDDKVGVFVALNAFLYHDVMKAAFFRDEEIGCVGSELADMDFFADCAFVIQADRRGNDDIVTNIYGTQLMSAEFMDALRPMAENYKFGFTTGMLTDVYTLRRNGLEICTFNMSAGYHNPHTAREVVVLADVIKVVKFVDEVIDTLGKERWPAPSARHSGFSLFGYDDYDDAAFGYRGAWAGGHTRHYGGVRKWVDRAEFADDMEEQEEEIDGSIFVGEEDYLDRCPLCHDASVFYDDTVDRWFCVNCLDYIAVDDVEAEEGVLVDG